MLPALPRVRNTCSELKFSFACSVFVCSLSLLHAAVGMTLVAAVAQAITVLAQAIDRLSQHPHPATLSPAVQDMFKHIAPEVGWGQRVILTNLWLLKPVLMVPSLELVLPLV